MARPFKASKYAVFDYLSENALQGKPIPPLTTIREAIGGGSYHTISNFVNAWKEEVQPVKKVEQILTPNDFSAETKLDITNNLVDLLISTANPVLEDKIKKGTQPSKDLLEIANIDLNSALEDNKRLEETLEKERTLHSEALKKIKEEHSEEITRLMAKVGSLVAQQTASLTKENEDLKAKISALKSELANIKSK